MGAVVPVLAAGEPDRAARVADGGSEREARRDQPAEIREDVVRQHRLQEQARKIHDCANIQPMRSTCARSRGPGRCCPGRSSAGSPRLSTVDSEPDAKRHVGSASEPKSSTAVVVNADIERPASERTACRARPLSGRVETVASAHAEVSGEGHADAGRSRVSDTIERVLTSKRPVSVQRIRTVEGHASRQVVVEARVTGRTQDLAVKCGDVGRKDLRRVGGYQSLNRSEVTPDMPAEN